MLRKLNELSVAAKLGAALLVAALAVAGGYYGWVKNVQDSNTAKTQELATKQAKNRKLHDFENKVTQLDRDIIVLKQQVELQKKIVPDEKEAAKFIILLQETATNAGVELRRLEAKEISTKEFYTEVPFALEIDGSYYGLVNFFDRLANLERIVNVEGLKMIALAKSKKSYQYGPNESVGVECTAKTFFSRESAAPVAAQAGSKKK